jgi:hypothetical protein
MSGRARMLLADGRWSTARKTLARRTYVPPHERPDTRLMLLLPPALSLVSVGPTDVPGVSIAPGPMVIASGKDYEWVHRQMARWLRQAVRFQEMVLTLTLERGDVRRSQGVSIQPDGVVEYPRGGRKPLRFER